MIIHFYLNVVCFVRVYHGVEIVLRNEFYSFVAAVALKVTEELKTKLVTL